MASEVENQRKRIQVIAYVYTPERLKDHIAKKRKELNFKLKEIKWLIGRKSHLSIENKVLIYKAIMKPIWSYGIELWGCASKSHIVIMQRTQSKILRAIANAP
jgi:hypothetical protein